MKRGEERQHGRNLALRFYRYHFAEFPHVAAKTAETLQICNHLYKHTVCYYTGMPRHFQQHVEKVVFLIAFVRVPLYFRKFGRVLPLLVYLRYNVHAEAESVSVRIIFQKYLAQTKHIKVEYMRVAGIRFLHSAVAAEKVGVPKREVAEVR